MMRAKQTQAAKARQAEDGEKMQTKKNGPVLSKLQWSQLDHMFVQ
jgi:hypothetical protein